MLVMLRVEGHLREFFPHLQEPIWVEADETATVAEILKQAGIPPELPGAVICRRVRVEREFVPADGDELIVLSPLAGG